MKQPNQVFHWKKKRTYIVGFNSGMSLLNNHSSAGEGKWKGKRGGEKTLSLRRIQFIVSSKGQNGL